MQFHLETQQGFWNKHLKFNKEGEVAKGNQELVQKRTREKELT